MKYAKIALSGDGGNISLSAAGRATPMSGTAAEVAPSTAAAAT